MSNRASERRRSADKRGNLVLLIMLIVLAFAGVACHKPAKALSASGPLKPCKLPGIDEELLCGKLTVFENRATRSGRTIDLNVVVLPALDPGSKAEPLFHLEGGPGVAATGSASFYAKKGRNTVAIEM